MLERSSMRRAGLAAAALAAALAIVTLGACASGASRKSQADFVQFVTQIAGDYDNRAQVLRQPELGAVQVSIQPAYAPALGKQVFYVHETAADDPRRIVSQRLVAVMIDEKSGAIAQHDWIFVDAPRWRTAREQPDLFKSLILDDVKETPPRKLAFDGDELTLQIAAGRGATALRLQRSVR